MTDWESEGWRPCKGCGGHHGSIGAQINCLGACLIDLRRHLAQLVEQATVNIPRLEKLDIIEKAVAEYHSYGWKPPG